MKEWALALTVLVVSGLGVVTWWWVRYQMRADSDLRNENQTLRLQLAALRELLPMTYATTDHVDAHVARFEQRIKEVRDEGNHREQTIIETIRAESALTRTMIGTLSQRVDNLVDRSKA